MSTPNVPPRPTRASGGSTAVKQDTPQIPPRPTRRSEASQEREAFTRSPLNEPASAFSRPPINSNRLAPHEQKDRRSSSINLPSEVGQEGMEYTSYDQLPAEAHGVKSAGGSSTTASAAPDGQTKEVSADVPLHQPKASVPQSTATSRIATVTRTDSTQAAAAGIGKARPDDDVHSVPTGSGESHHPLSRVTSQTYGGAALGRVSSADLHPLKAKSSFNRSSPSLHGGRPPSIHGADYGDGIPLIGIQSPLYPNAGDVQAPSPAPTQSQHTPGIGFFNDGSQRAHHRKRSSRQEFGPPGSYGMHGHGTESHDQFEKAWLAKHPDEAMKEHYSPYALRPESALSTEQLNKLVRENGEAGFGTSPAMIGTPSQDIAHEASEQLASRYASPKPSPLPLGETKKRASSGHQPPLESPLRKGSMPGGDRGIESDDDQVIHVDGPLRRGNKVTGGGAMDNTIDLGPTGGNTEEHGGVYDERGEGTPILASDEIMKRPGSAFLEPAVEPGMGRTDDDYYDSDHFPPSRRSSVQPPSRPSSRPSSVHGAYMGGSLHRFISHEEHHASGMHTPLEEIDEYEPLFPEGEDAESKPKKLEKARPGLAHHHFPSQDVWEDTPDSLQYHTTVETPEPPREEKLTVPDVNPATTFETPEQEQARREDNAEDMTSDNKTFVKPHFKAGVAEDMHRPGIQRFPSRDIWEDSPDSMRLETTVSGPQMDEMKSPPDDTPAPQNMVPQVPSRPEKRSKLAQEIKPDLPPQQSDSRADNVPDIGTKKPQLPDRTKPSVPARPARFSNSDHAQSAPLAKSQSNGSEGSSEAVTSPPIPKTKPAVPARPAGSKIAALQAGFMNDLNNRLKIGPQQPKVQEPEPEAEEPTAKEPLADARKSRARGPTRRKPAASPSAAPGDSAHAFSISSPTTLWHIDEKDELNVAASHDEPAGKESETAELERVLSANEEKNTEEPTLAQPPSDSAAEPTVQHSEVATSSEAKNDEGPASHVAPEAIAADEMKPVPAGNESNQKEIESGLEKALAQAEPAPTSAEDVQGKGVGMAGQLDDVGGREAKESAAGDAVLRSGGDETVADA